MIKQKLARFWEVFKRDSTRQRIHRMSSIMQLFAIGGLWGVLHRHGDPTLQLIFVAVFSFISYITDHD